MPENKEKKEPQPSKKTEAITKVEPVLDLLNVSVEDAVQTVHQYINTKANKAEVMQFLHICRAWELDPFKREVHLVKYKESEPAQIVIGYEVYIKRAEKSGLLAGWKTWIENYGEQDFKACIEIKRKDWEEPFRHEVYFEEYAQYTKDSSGNKILNKFWRKRRTQIIKVVISQGFRLCFSTDLGNLPYAIEEMSASGAIEGEVIEEKPVIVEERPEKKESPREKSGKVEKPPKKEPKSKKESKPEPSKEEAKEEPPPPPAGLEPELSPEDEKAIEAEIKEDEGETPTNEQPAQEEKKDDVPTQDEIDDRKELSILEKVFNQRLATLINDYGRYDNPGDAKKRYAAHLKKALSLSIKPEEIPTKCSIMAIRNLIKCQDLAISEEMKKSGLEAV